MSNIKSENFAGHIASAISVLQVLRFQDTIKQGTFDLLLSHIQGAKDSSFTDSDAIELVFSRLRETRVLSRTSPAEEVLFVGDIHYKGKRFEVTFKPTF